ncbi:MAG: hypothetical protein ACKVOA_10750 [Methylophilaceae bacterium]
MMNKKLTQIIILQTLLILGLFWVLIFYGKDEYEAYQAQLNTEVVSPNHIQEKLGISVITLSPEIQKNSGISSEKVSAITYSSTQKSVGNVVAIDSLIEAKSKYLSFLSEASIARATNSQNLKQYQRLKALNEDDKNVSDLAVQEALANANADQARMNVAELQLNNLQSTTKLQWGDELAKLVFNDKLPPYLQNLLNRKNMLVQMSLPTNASTPKTGSVMHIAPLSETAMTIRAIYISPAAQTDTSSYGKTFYFSAPAETLRIGMRVIAENPYNSSVNRGAVVPSKAVVWYGGKPWAYFKQGKDQFVRKPISTDTETNKGWFNKDISANSEVVVNGAQLLLSEEFKYQIKNENED